MCLMCVQQVLFGGAKHIMTTDRQNMDPGTLEMLLLLKYNKDLWSARTIENIINKEIPPLAGQKHTWIVNVRLLASLIAVFNCFFCCVFVKLRMLGDDCNTIGTIAIVFFEHLFTAWAILLMSKSGAILWHYYFPQPWV